MLDLFTFSANQIEMYFNDTKLSSGTCFFWHHLEDTYLVTNWHNVSGINPNTGENLSPTGGRPNNIKFDIWFTDGNSVGIKQASCKLYKGDSPIWLEHPVHGSKVDVVAIKLPQQILGGMFATNNAPQTDFQLHIGQEVFILGFPFAVHAQGSAIWKRGTIASEIEIDLDDMPKFFIDTATASGMSGSPVFARVTNGISRNGDHQMYSPHATKFLGVYSGRFGSKVPVEVQLGYVWKAPVIEEIISGQKLGQAVI